MITKTPERQFRVSFVVGEKRLGTVLADINGAPGLQVDLLKEHDADKNLPQGTFRDMAVETLKQNGGSMPRKLLLEALVSRGIVRPRFHTAIAYLREKGVLRISGKNGSAIIHLTKKGT